MKEYIDRNLLNQLITHLDDRQIFVLLGPRQAGKTTLFQILMQYLYYQRQVAKENVFYFTFEDPEVTAQYNQDPKEFISRRIENLGSRAYFFFDEYHWVKDGGRKLKLLFDLFSPQVKFLITGSSSLEITFKTGKYLVGRAYYFHLFPLSFEEFLKTKEKEVLSAYQEANKLLNQFDLPQKTVFDNKLRQYFCQFCLFGGYPELTKRKGQEDKIILLKAIVKTYLEKDVRSLLLIEDLESYRKLLQILSAQIGNLLSYDHLSSDTGINYKLLKQYLSILEETFVVRRIRPFYKNVTSELRKNPKLYFIDSGLANALLNIFTPLDERTDKGKLVENFVFSQLYKSEQSIHFWRTKGKAEVDFVISPKSQIYPIEVKYQKFKKAKVSRSLNSFISNYQPEKTIVLTNGFLKEIKKEKTKVIFAPVWYW